MSRAPRCRPNVGSYGYRPSLDAGIAFTVLFGITLLISLYFTARRRLWFLSFALGAALEFAGWLARTLAHSQICSKDIYITQTVCLILAPAFYSAALYLLLGILAQRAPTVSLLRPRTYLIVFCTADLASLVLQAIGGGMASGANTRSQLDTGTNIVVAGIFVQLAAMTVFAILGLHYIVAAGKRQIYFHKGVLGLAILATMLIFIRNIFRAIELLGGWNGHLMKTEKYLIALDAAPMLLCQLCFCVLGLLDTLSKDDSLLHRQRRKELLELEKASEAPSSSASVSASA